MQISIKVAIDLKSTLEKKIQNLIMEANRNMTVNVEKDEVAPIPERSIDIIVLELTEVKEDLRTLKQLIREANKQTTIVWNDVDLDLAEALDLVRDERSDAEIFHNYGTRQKRVRAGGSMLRGESIPLFTIALYDPEQYRTLAEKMDRQNFRLSNLIDEANTNTKIEFAEADKYIG